MGYGLTSDNSHSRPADVLVTRWEKSKWFACSFGYNGNIFPLFLPSLMSLVLTAGITAVYAESHRLCPIGCSNL